MKDDDKHVNMAHARADHQKRVMQQIIADGVCPFCRENFETYHTKPILFETAHWVVTENFAPYEGTKHHILLVAKEHCEGPWDLSKEAWGDLQEAVTRVRKDLALPGGTLFMRWGATDYTGASVTHLHTQLVSGSSRKEGGEPILTALGYKAQD